MQKLKISSQSTWLLALLVALSAEACSSDTGGKGAPDGSMADAAVTTNLDARSPDAPGTDVGMPDMAAMDTGGADMGAADAAAVDAPSVDGAAVDSGQASPAARGQYLVDHVIGCSDCHTPKLASGAPDMTKYLAGNATFVTTPTGDALPSRNLTPDPTTGLGSYTADQIKHMFLDGVVPAEAGTAALNPTMPYYVFHNMAAQDADAIVAYLQSVKAVNNPIPPRSAAFDVAVPADYLDPTTIPSPAASYPQLASAQRGRYLATESGLCIECHTQHLPSGPMPLDTSKFFQGGEDFSALFAGTLNIHPISANLTSDPTTGLGDWTTGQIVTVLLAGIDDQGAGICPPMPVGPNGAYGGLTAGDALDIANYIKSLPPAVNDVPDMCSWPPTAPPVDGGGFGTDGAGMDGAAIDGARRIDSAAIDSTSVDTSSSG
jgi:mono/diheme cytochrome c family protein